MFWGNAGHVRVERRRNELIHAVGNRDERAIDAGQDQMLDQFRYSITGLFPGHGLLPFLRCVARIEATTCERSSCPWHLRVLRRDSRDLDLHYEGE